MDELTDSIPEANEHHGQPPRDRALARVLLAAGIVLLIGLVAGVFAWSANDSASGGGDDRVSGPRIGRDHWHATYAVYAGAERQPNMPTWESGVHTHSDGIIHIHPFQAFEEGKGAALTKFFEYGGGVLTDAQLRIPGDARTYFDGDPAPGRTDSGHIYIVAAGASASEHALEDLDGDLKRVSPDYIPQDGDRILIFFATEGQMRATIASQGTTVLHLPLLGR